MWGLMGAGLGVFAGVYTITAISGYATEHDTLTAPLVGPLIMLGQHPCSNCAAYGSDRSIAPGLIIDFIAQSSGLVMAIVGGVVKRPVRVYDRARMSLAPVFSPSMTGLVAAGQF